MTNVSKSEPTKQTPDFFEVLSELISIPSVKSEPLPDAPYGKYTARALDYMLSLGREYGFSVKNLDGRVGYIEWGTGDKMMAILCHLDVVPPGDGWDSDPYTLTRRNGLLIGRGVIDDKGPAVCVFFSLLRLKNEGFTPPCRIRLILGLDEEHGCSCMEYYVKHEELPIAGFTPDADFPAIFAEKGILEISLSGKPSGSCLASAGEAPNMVPSSCNISFTDTGDSFSAQGIPAHASTPDAGVNAILEALSQIPAERLSGEPVLAFINKYFADEMSADLFISSALPDISGELTINPSILTINERIASITLDIRYPVKSNVNQILQEISDNATGFDLHMEIISHLRPKFIDPESEQIRNLLSVYEKHQASLCKLFRESNIPPPEAVYPVLPVAIGGGTYARTMPGIVAFGPTLPWEESQMHRKNEGFSESVALQLIDLYKDAIKNLSENIG